jgi:hypothetical protein
MPRIFNATRQRMLTQHRFTRYLFYAMGEIVLVVFGILIALQVNDHATERRERMLERKVLGELLQNLHADSTDHANNRDRSVRISASAAHVVGTLEARLPWHDSMAVHYGWLIPHGVATLNTTAYENLKSIGFNLIRSDSLRMAITHYYTVQVALLLTVEREFGSESLAHHIIPALVKHIRVVGWGDARPNDHASLMNDMEFQNVMRWKVLAMHHSAGEYENGRKNAAVLIALLERELAKAP